MSQQSDRQAAIRAVTGTALTYEGDWMALFDAAGIPAGTFDGRLLAWINLKLGSSYTEINGAMAAFAIFNGAANFSSLGNFDATTNGSYEGLVATRLQMPQANYTGNQWLMSRSNHVATDNITSLKLAFANFYIQDNQAQEYGNGAPATVTASIEYPTGTFTQVLFSGSTSGTIPAVSASGGTTEVGTIISDYANVTIPLGARFWVRFYFTCTGGIVFAGSADAANGDLLAAGPTPGAGQDKTMGGTIVDGGSGFCAVPIAIIAHTMKPSVIAIGDSICYGHGDATASATDLARGSICRGIPSTIANLNLASSSSFAQTFLSVAASRAVLFPYCSHAVFEHAINDLLTSPYPSGAAVAGYNQALASAFPSRVKKLLTTTLPATYGSWTTLGGQTPRENSAGRLAYNALVRGGSVAGFNDYLELADQLESSRDSGLWTVSPSPPYTADGVHPNAAGYQFTTTYVASVAASKFAYP